jgi:predicted HD phosphohydrolase
MEPNGSLGARCRFDSMRGVADATYRYLTAVDAAYYDGLSEASKGSLRFQGGPFRGAELEAFEQDPLKDEMVQVRLWDDQAKVVGIEDVTPRPAAFRSIIQRYLEAQL